MGGVRTFVYVNNHYAGHAPTTTKRLMEDLLAKEEEHADDLADLLVDLDVNPSTKRDVS